MTEQQREPGRLVRPGLKATREDLADGVILIQRWLHDLEDLLEDLSNGQIDADTAYELIASIGRLERVQPELLADCDGEGLVAQARSEFDAHRDDLLTAALELPVPSAWLEDVERYEQVIEGATEDVRGVAAVLLEDLDDVELVVTLAERHGRDVAGLQAELEQCRSWLAGHGELFLDADIAVQSICLGIRSDLNETSPDLQASVEKFVAVLDAMEAAEKELDAPLFGTLGADWLAAQKTQAKLRDEAFDRAVEAADQESDSGTTTLASEEGVVPFGNAIQQRTYAMAAAAQSETPDVGLLEWRSPGGYLAQASVAGIRDTSGSLVIQLSIETATGDPAVDLAGKPVTIVGLEGLQPAPLNDSGQCLLSLEQSVPDDIRSLPLQVGDEQWEPSPL